MIYKKAKDQKGFESPACGWMRDIVRHDDVNIVVADNIKPNKPHFHKKTIELYLVLKGSISIQVKKGSEVTVVVLDQGDVLLLEPGECHQITKSSDDNQLLVVCTPAWSEEDEFIVEEL